MQVEELYSYSGATSQNQQGAWKEKTIFNYFTTIAPHRPSSGLKDRSQVRKTLLDTTIDKIHFFR